MSEPQNNPTERPWFKIVAVIIVVPFVVACVLIIEMLNQSGWFGYVAGLVVAIVIGVLAKRVKNSGKSAP
jgi:hypothetical protein